MNINKILDTPTQLIALTSLTRNEFDKFFPIFKEEWRKWYKHYDFHFKRRTKPLTAIQIQTPTRTLPAVKDKLFFVLFPFKNNHLQQALAAAFDMEQSQVSIWLKVLEPLLQITLKKMGINPARNADELAKMFRSRQDENNTKIDKPKVRTMSADGTDRTIGRSTDYEIQKLYYSGKHHQHGVKNTIIADEYQFVHFVGCTFPGARHDKAIADEEIADFTDECYRDIWLAKDSGYQGFQPAGVHLLEPFKATKNNPLNQFQKDFNHWVSRVRITVENAIGSIKRCRLVKEKWRGKILERIDRCMEIAAGLHNLRIVTRKTTYEKAEKRIDELLFF
jgi:hypothetical protein